MSELSIQHLVDLLKTIADETRLRILGIVAAGPVTGKDLAEQLDLSPATISHHMRKLTDVGIVVATADAQRQWYSIDNDLLLASRRTPFSAPPASPSSPRLPGDTDEDAAFRAKTVRDFFDGRRLKSIPTQRKKRVVVLQHLVAEFDPSLSYPETKVNEILRQSHEDVATLRRELVDYGYMSRERGIYTVARAGPTRSVQVAQEITGAEDRWLQSILTGVIGSVVEDSGSRRQE